YLDVATLTDFRVELNGSQWGFIPIFLPEFGPKAAAAVGPTRKLMSILMLHDVIVWPKWANTEEVYRGLAMLRGFGITSAEFVPYYAEEPLAVTGAANLHVSGYRNATRSLLIVANLGREPVRDSLCLVDSQAARFESWPERQLEPSEGACMMVEVEAGSYAMYVATP
ncbi:MAG: hypothetical protein NT025_00290, partial [bacterium]|nr:hypothetical protein [bacterium]